MSRSIKFRCWDSATGKVSEPFDVKESWGDYLIDFDDYSTDGALDSIIWEQYTGLKDKNGIEIYEGDIVEGDMGVFEVKWYDLVAQFMFRPNMSMEYHPPFTSTQLEVMEVIGNIHENPELLGGEE